MADTYQVETVENINAAMSKESQYHALRDFLSNNYGKKDDFIDEHIQRRFPDLAEFCSEAST